MPLSTKNVLSNGVVLSRTNFVTLSDVAKINSETWKAFGLWLKAERERAGLTQEEVAEATDTHVKTISRIENGEPTKRSTVAKLAKAVGADEKEAVNRAFLGSQLPYNEWAMDFNGFDDEDMAWVREQIEMRRAWKERRKESSTKDVIEYDDVPLFSRPRNDIEKRK